MSAGISNLRCSAIDSPVREREKEERREETLKITNTEILVEYSLFIQTEDNFSKFETLKFPKS